MRVVSGRGVNQLYPAVVDVMRRETEPQNSRAGRVRVLPTPFCAVYERPDEMVLFDPVRNCNPAFHFCESLWMLAGRSDAAYLNNYVRDFGDRFANPLGHLDGAYGPRWRTHFRSSSFGSDDRPIDQVELAIEKLRANPDDRRVVIQMWDPGVDNDPSTRDACCNQQIFPRIVGGRLDFTLTCRSNDAVWGALGANCVHFPMLQLYVAGRLGVPVGKFYQFSNNYHVYEAVFDKLGSPRPALLDPYLRGEVEPLPIGDDWDNWDRDLELFHDWHDKIWSPGLEGPVWVPSYANRWFTTTASPLVTAFWFHRRGRPDDARASAEVVEATDWRRACLDWLERAALRAAARTPDSALAVDGGDAASPDVRPA